MWGEAIRERAVGVHVTGVHENVRGRYAALAQQLITDRRLAPETDPLASVLPDGRANEGELPGGAPSLRSVTPQAGATNQPNRRGWPVASSTDIHRSPFGSTLLVLLIANVIGTCTNRPRQRPTTIAVRPAIAACTAACASRMQ